MDKLFTDNMSKKEIEEISFNKTYKQGKCKNTVFAGDGHRTGFVPIIRPDDGGLPGVIAQQICLECGKKLKNTVFLADNK